MQFSDIERMCDRAARHIFEKKKLALTSCILAALGVLVIFAMGLSLAANQWITLTLAFLPIFISANVLVALGVVLIRAYHDEVKKKEVKLSKIISGSLSYLLAAGYFFLPIAGAYFLLWIVLGIFFILQNIPFVGPFFSVVFAFGPFLLLLIAILLGILSTFVVFAVSPLAGLKSLSGYDLVKQTYQKVLQTPAMQVILFCIAVIPVGILSFILYLTAYLTAVMYVIPDSDVVMVLQWFFIMLPFAVILSPAIVFFFNMAAEAHIHLQRKEG